MIDPGLFGEGLAGELEGWVASGARGIKVHPVICGHYPDDPRMHPIYEIAREQGLVVLTDTTAHPDKRGRQVGAPLEWVPVLERFPGLKLQIAHLPGGLWEDRIELARRFTENVWFDTSQGFVDALHRPLEHRQVDGEAAVGVLRAIGTHRVLFASDAPGGGVDVVDLASQILRLDLTDDEKERILAGNAKQLLDL
jgi:predicted TIM-barrel fold metal-dependent hydrolase